MPGQDSTTFVLIRAMFNCGGLATAVTVTVKEQAAFGVVPFVIVVPMTTVRRGLSWHVEVEHDANNGLSETSYVQCELLRAVRREQLVRRLGPIDAATSAEVSDVLRTLLNLGRW